MKYKINDEVIVKSTGRTTYIIGIRNNEYQLNDHRMSGCNCYREYELVKNKSSLASYRELDRHVYSLKIELLKPLELLVKWFSKKH